MKAVTIKELNHELGFRTPKELRELCLRLSKFKKENKELLTYLLFESSDEDSYIESIHKEIDMQFALINRKSEYLMKKNIRKILLNTKKCIRYSQKKKTEVDLLIYFCTSLKEYFSSVRMNSGLLKLFNRQIDYIRKKISYLHEDLQYDYGAELNGLKKQV
jgi:predicted nucleotidyltransferase